MAENNLEQIIKDLKGISVFEKMLGPGERLEDIKDKNTGEPKLVSHIEKNLEYPAEGIVDAIYSKYTLGMWSEREITTIEYMFIENVSGVFKKINQFCAEYSLPVKTVKDVKESLEHNGHKIDYIIKREKVEGLHWGWFNDTVYAVKGGENGS